MILRNRVWTISGIAAFACAAIVSSASAADLPMGAPAYKAPPATADAWTVTIGAEGEYLPDFVGAKTYGFGFVPLFEVRKAGTPRNFTAPNDGIGFAVFDTGNFRIGPVGKYVFERKADRLELGGLGNVDFTVELGVFAEYYPVQWLRTRAEVRQGIGGHEGLVADLSADGILPLTQQLTFSTGPRLTLETSPAINPYFGVDATQSALSGLPIYHAKGGLYSVGWGAQLRYEWTRNIATNVFAEYTRLTDSVENSPLVVRYGTPDQVTVGAGITYSFDIPALIPGLF